ncbi:MAG: DNA mismatch repair endonuclease MutL [Clostridiaceae bacterium]|nr:DNA mismatch repair endonuclease MutL [Clostridiaceae bacterium]
MTMTLIHKLDKQTINSIAAGEVIERPASIAKELIENALDAGASFVRLSIERGGIKKISCEDDGAGMSREDALLALESHATSKLVRTEDLFLLETMGFRGEALPSIAAVSRLELRTRRREDEEGTRILVEGGERTFEGPCGMAPGTAIQCRDLFYNTPARYKFLRSDASEAGAVAGITGKMALTRPDVSFRLERGDDGKELLYTPGDNQLLSAIYAVFGNEAAREMRPLSSQEAPVKITGFMTGPTAARHNRSRQVFIVNGRVIQSPILRSAVDEACKTWFMKGRYPQLVISLVIPGNLVDVNVHPQKTELRFWEERSVFRAVFHAVRAALEEEAHIVRPSPAEKQLQEEETLPPARQLDLGNLVSYRKTGPAFQEEEHPQAGGEAGLPVRDDTAPAKRKEDPAVKEEMASLLEARLIGTFLNTYILLDDSQSLVLIDQHAAHERILYEELLTQRNEEGDLRAAGQILMTPLRMELSAEELSLLEEEAEYFNVLGFDYQAFGGNTIALRAVPSGKAGRSAVNPSAAFRAALDALAAARRTGREPDDAETLHQIACKAAVKANDRLSEDEIRLLIKGLVTLSNPFHCPHGRPVALRFSREDIEKLFGRIV